MGRIVHIALKCRDRDGLEKATTFYEDIFGLYQTKEDYVREHLSRHMTDGNIDMTLVLYDSEDVKEAKLSGPGAQIHHIGIEVQDRPTMIAKIEANGGTIYSDKKEGALKYYAAGGTLGEIVGPGRYLKKDPSPLARIVNIALRVDDLEKATAFYQNVFGFKPVNTGKPGQRVELTDGETALSLIFDRDAVGGPRIDTWRFEVKDAKAVAELVKQKGGEVLSSEGNIVKFRGPDGNTAEVIAA